MADLASLTALAFRIHGDATADLDLGRAVPALKHASGLVRGASGGQRLEFVSQETVILCGGEQVLALPQRPAVVDIDNPLTVVELDDFGGVDFAAVEDRDFSRIGNELTRGHPWMRATRLAGWPHNRPLGIWAPRVQVTYSHGYPVIPDEIESIVLDIAQSFYDNPSGLRSFTTPEYSETYATEVLGVRTVKGIKSALTDLGYRRSGAFSI